MTITVRKPLQQFALIALCAAAAAQEYHVAPGGDDAKSGTEPAEAFRTIQHAATVAAPGDTVTVQPGTYRETVEPANSGTEQARIVYRAAPGGAVVISGVDPVTGWTAAGNGTWQAPLAADAFPSSFHQSLQVFVNGAMVHLARWPNTEADPARPTKARLTRFISKKREGNVTTVTFEDDALPAQSLVGAEIYVQPNAAGWGWTLSGKVTGHAGKRLTVQSHSDSGEDGSPHQWAVGSRYYVFNQRALLDVDGEWWHDTSAGVLHLRPAGGDPNRQRVEAKRRDFAFNLSGKSHITVSGFTLFACTLTTDDRSGGDGVPYERDGSPRYPWRNEEWLAPSTGIVVEKLDASYLNHFTDVSGHFFLQWTQNTGVVLSGTGHIIRDCRIRWGAGNGVALLGRGHKVLNNWISDVDYTSVDCGGIQVGPHATYDCEIAHNTIERTARSGMLLRGLTNSDPAKGSSRVHHNEVVDFMEQDWDGGAFYTYGTDGRFTRIDHNIFRSTKPRTGMVFGAYWDFSKNYILDHNLIVNVPVPIQVTKAFPPTDGRVNNLVIVHNTALPSGQWGRPIVQMIGDGSVIANNLFQVDVFADPKGQLVNHWPAYGDRKVEAAGNLIWGNDPAGYNGKPQDNVAAKDQWVEDPGLVDAARGDYRLSEASPAKDSAVAISQPIQRDGVSVRLPVEPLQGVADRGAFEYGQPAWSAGSSLVSAKAPSAAAAPTSAAGKTAKPAALAEFNARLRTRIAVLVAAGQGPELEWPMGAATVPVRIDDIAADGTTALLLYKDASRSRITIAWSQIGLKECLALAQRTARPLEAADAAVLAFYLLAAGGSSADVEQALGRAGAEATAVRAAF